MRGCIPKFFLGLLVLTWLLPAGPGPAEAARFLNLFTAIVENDLGRVRQCTPGGMAINEIDVSSGATPLTWAAMKGADSRITAWLIDNGADPEQKDGEGETPLTTAARSGNLEVVRVLLSRGADPRRTNDRGLPPWVLACGQNGNLEIVKLLAPAQGSLNNIRGTTAVEYARAFKNRDIEAWLRSRGAKPSYFNAVKKIFH